MPPDRAGHGGSYGANRREAANDDGHTVSAFGTLPDRVCVFRVDRPAGNHSQFSGNSL